MDNTALWKTVVLRKAEQFWQNNKYLASVSEMSFVALTVLSACDLMHFIPVSLANKIMLPSSSLKTAGAANKAQFRWFQNLSGVSCSEMRFFCPVWDTMGFSKSSLEFKRVYLPLQQPLGGVLCLSLCAVGLLQLQISVSNTSSGYLEIHIWCLHCVLVKWSDISENVLPPGCLCTKACCHVF